jgi:diguanylate cyclase (GGDEF)-like protein
MAGQLIAWLKGVWSPPVFSDEDRTAAARMLYAMAGTVIVIATPLVLLMILFVPAATMRWWMLAGGIDIVCVALVVMTRRGWVGAAGWFLAIAAWVVLTWAAWISGGVSSPAITAQLVVVVLAGMLLGWEEGVGAAVVCIGTVFALAYARVAGFLPPSTLTATPYSIALTLMTCIVVIAFLQVLIMRTLRSARDRAIREVGERSIAEQQLRDVIDNAPFGAFGLALGDDGRLVVTTTNRAADAILHFDTSQLLGLTAEEAFPSLERAGVTRVFRRVAASSGVYEAANFAWESEEFNGVLDLHAFRAGEGSMAFFFRDVTEQREAEELVKHLAYHDALTGLPNRQMFADQTEMALANAQRHGDGVGVLFVDLDEFKPVNDQYGHAVGDAVLVAVAERLKRSARAGDTVARFGGDEFTVLLPHIETNEQAIAVARKLLAVLEEPFPVAGHVVSVGASIGVSVSLVGERDATSLLQRADKAMYRMKGEGRGGYRLWS